MTTPSTPVAVDPLGEWPSDCPPDLRFHLEHVVDRLAEEFPGLFSRQTLVRTVADSYVSLGKVTVATYLPVFAHRFARERLRACAIVEGQLVKDRPEILVACRQNAGRSIAASVLLDHYAEGRAVVRSAGSTPADEIHPEIKTVLAERGLSTEGLFPKPFTDEMVQAADVVITMGCGEACPVFPGKRYLDWTVDDPFGQPLDVVRRIVDDIDGRIRTLLAELLPGEALAEPPEVVGVPDSLAAGAPVIIVTSA